MEQNTSRLSGMGAGIALASTLVIVFVLCALAQVVFPGLQASHMWLALFTAAPIGSATAWVEGLLSNIVFGFIAGYVFAWSYNRTVNRKA